MEDLFRRESFDLVLDATHPYASVVTENIAESCAATETEYLRLLRDDAGDKNQGIYVEDIAGAVDYLSGTEGPILLTTGSKELARFTALPDFADRSTPVSCPWRIPCGSARRRDCSPPTFWPCRDLFPRN